MSNATIIQEFIDSWATRDVDKIISFFTEDALYHNIPMEPMTGTTAIREGLTGFVAMSSEIEWVTHNISESTEGVVLTERLDRFLINGHWLELPVMGTFELREGKIAAWRDYFDLKQIAEVRMARQQKAMAAAAG